ncbi:hypothetical protein PMAYCL1PPCAC_13044, partial [Pristionchus mayeri]
SAPGTLKQLEDLLSRTVERVVEDLLVGDYRAVRGKESEVEDSTQVKNVVDGQEALLMRTKMRAVEKFMLNDEDGEGRDRARGYSRALLQHGMEDLPASPVSSSNDDSVPGKILVSESRTAEEC